MQIYAQAVVAAAPGGWQHLDMDNVARIRNAKGLTQTQLAEMIGANQATISKIESGTGNPTLEMINRIAKALDVNPGELFARPELEQRVYSAITKIGDPERMNAALVVLESMARR